MLKSKRYFNIYKITLNDFDNEFLSPLYAENYILICE